MTRRQATGLSGLLIAWFLGILISIGSKQPITDGMSAEHQLYPYQVEAGRWIVESLRNDIAYLSVDSDWVLETHRDAWHVRYEGEAPTEETLWPQLVALHGGPLVCIEEGREWHVNRLVSSPPSTTEPSGSEKP